MERAIAFATSLFSGSTLTKKASLNSIASGIEYCARFVVTFFVTPFLVAGLGDVFYGVWMVILRLTDYLTAGGRSSQALKWFVVNRQESEDGVEKRRGVGAAIAAWIVFLPLQIVLGGIVSWYLPIWLNVSPAAYFAVRTTAMIVVASLVLHGFADIPRSVLIGQNLGYKRVWVSAPLAVLGGGLTLLALHLKLGLIGVACATLATVFFTGLVLAFVARHNVSWFGFSMPDRTMVMRFVGWSWWFTLWEFIARVMMASDVVLLGILVSPEIVATYTIVRFLPDGVLRFLTTLIFETVPGIGKIFASGDLSRAAAIRGEVMLLAWLSTTSVGATVLMWNRSFVELWVGSDYVVAPMSMLCIVVMIFQFVWIRADADFINLTLDLRRKVLLGTASAVTSLVFAFLLIRITDDDIAGLCVGFILGRVILSVGYPTIISRVFNVSVGQQVRTLLRPISVSVVFFALSTTLSTELSANHWLGLGLFSASTLAVSSLVAYWAGLSTGQRQIVARRIKLIGGGITR